MRMWPRRRGRGGCAPAVVIAALLSVIVVPAGAQQQARPAIQNEGDKQLIAVLLRTTLIALHQANVTGNYTILRDLASPTFQQRNTAADLALVFAPLRRQNIDLAPAALLQPQFAQAPVIDQGNMLRMSGTLSTKPVGVDFDLAFQFVSGSWRLSGISIARAKAPGGR